MHIVLDLVREIIVDHTLDTLHIKTTRRHIGSQHQRRTTRTEFTEYPVTFTLCLITVNCQCWETILTKQSCQVIAGTLGRTENQDATTIHQRLQNLHQLLSFLKLLAAVDHLCDRRVRRDLSRTNRDLDGITQKLGGQLMDCLRPGGTPEKSLTIGTDLTNDLADLGLETHIEHAIGLIEHQIGDTTQVGLAALEQIDQTARCGDHHLDTALQITDLRTLRRTTIQTGVLDARRGAELVHLLLDLHGEFASWRQDQNDRTVSRLQVGLRIDVHHARHAEGQRLTGTGFGQAD
mmetsp:Transcript_24768/g.62173  ORF Transcript_24768/g.62173 Transcript_24768/m.62173 type:complete len:292 (-) Transcript_24768:358-1233(-)